MDGINVILFICLAIPMCMMLVMFKGTSRRVCCFLLTGMFVAVLSGEINTLIEKVNELDSDFLSINVAPLVEEIAKAIPIVYIAFLMKPSKQVLAEYALAVGVGFATFENICIIINSGDTSFWFAFLRAIGAGMMHGVCTLIVGLAMNNVVEKRTTMIAGTLSAVSIAVISHSIYNMLIESKYMVVGLFLPMITFATIMIANGTKGKKIIKQIINK